MSFITPLIVTLAANAAQQQFTVAGTMVACVAATGDFEIAFGSGEFIPFGVGRSFDIPKDKLTRIQLRSVSGSAVTATILYGEARYLASALVTIQGSSLAISPANILSITPAAAVVATGFTNLANAAADFNGKRSINIVNTGIIDILVNGTTLPVGQSVGWSVERRQDTLNNINVDATGADGAAFVSFTA